MKILNGESGNRHPYAPTLSICIEEVRHAETRDLLRKVRSRTQTAATAAPAAPAATGVKWKKTVVAAAVAAAEPAPLPAEAVAEPAAAAVAPAPAPAPTAKYPGKPVIKKGRGRGWRRHESGFSHPEVSHICAHFRVVKTHRGQGMRIDVILQLLTEHGFTLQRPYPDGKIEVIRS